MIIKEEIFWKKIHRQRERDKERGRDKKLKLKTIFIMFQRSKNFKLVLINFFTIYFTKHLTQNLLT
jgi:hypothetical protein